jgi:hypothetical protein
LYTLRELLCWQAAHFVCKYGIMPASCFGLMLCLPVHLQELKKDYSLQVASQRTLEYGQVVLSADNIFNRCRQKSHIAHPPETNPLQQLEIIGSYVSDLLAICKKYGVELGKS